MSDQGPSRPRPTSDAADEADTRDNDPENAHAELAPNYYGGQAVIEGVMMRGADVWAVAARRPDGDIYLERHPVSDFPDRYPAFKKPMLRGMFALTDAMSIGVKALSISATQAMPEPEEGEDGEPEDDMSGAVVSTSLILALVFFVGVFIVLPNLLLTALVRPVLGDGLLYHLVEGLLRIAIFVGYLAGISLMEDIRRVFAYHGAEHKTIAAWEHGERLETDAVDGYSTLHVRCGTNFLIIVLLLALIVYSLAGVAVPVPAEAGWPVALAFQVGYRIVLLPVVAGLAYEGIRLGASRGDSPWVAALMRPGLWLQKITTKPPSGDMIEVAVRAFEAVVPAGELNGRVPDLPSALIWGPEVDAERVAPGQATSGHTAPGESVHGSASPAVGTAGATGAHPAEPGGDADRGGESPWGSRDV